MPEAAQVLFSKEEIGRRVRELGDEITRDYRDRDLVLVCVMKGSVVFLADLIRVIRLPARVDFMAISPYGEATEGSRVVRIVQDLDQDITGLDVLIVEDIVDTGLTLSYLRTTLEARNPRSIEVCTLLDRAAVRIAPLDVKYRGFDCPVSFVVGYGLDIGERWRNLPDILTVPDPDELETNPALLAPYLDGSVAGTEGAR